MNIQIEEPGVMAASADFKNGDVVESSMVVQVYSEFFQELKPLSLFALNHGEKCRVARLLLNKYREKIGSENENRTYDDGEM